MRLLQGLLAEKRSDVHITLVDRIPHHCLKTEYYALAAGTTADRHIRVAFPADTRFTMKCGVVTSVDLENHSVFLKNGESLSYDDLIIGLGCEDSYHQIPGARDYTLSIQSIEKARKTYETLNNIRGNGTVSIVGGGLSGVELASELYESRPDLSIRLFDRGETILSSLPERISRYVQNWFVNHGVKIVNGSDITEVGPNVVYNHGEPVASDAIVWTAGIRPNRLLDTLDIEKDNHGRIALNAYHQIPKHENVYVAGDCASLPFAPSAQLSELQGDQIVAVLKKKWKNESLPRLSQIKLKGTFGSLGKRQGFGMMGRTPLTGRVPRLLKSGILWMYKFQTDKHH